MDYLAYLSVIGGVVVLLVGLASIWLSKLIKDARVKNSHKITKNATDFVLDNVILNLKTDAAYKHHMDCMLKQNQAYQFTECQSYEEFKLQLFLSLGGNLKFKPDYEAVIDMLLLASNGYVWKALRLFPAFLLSFVRMRFNGLSITENTMHMLSLHATSIGGYLSQSLKEEFVTVLKKVRVVRENTGYFQGKQYMFVRVRDPFLGTRVCPLKGKHNQLHFPPLSARHSFLSLKNYGNALGVEGSNESEHLLDGVPLLKCEFMTNSNYWTDRFPEEIFECPHLAAAAAAKM